MMHDLVVIGAGPAGMAAACTGAALGLRTALLDEQPQPGGQIYRNVGQAAPRIGDLLGPDYLAGRAWVDRLQGSAVELHAGTFAWDVASDLTVTALQGERAFQLKTRQLIAATGAMERPSPIPGWTLPGVMNAGAAQIALKSAGLMPSGRVVIAGAGPLLLLVACQLLDAGAQVAGLVETSPASNRWQALAQLPRALGAPEVLRKGVRMLWRLRRAGIPWFRHASDLRVAGDERCTGLHFASGGARHEIEAGTVLLHHGVVPSTQLSRLLGVTHAWDGSQLAWRVLCDAHGLTSLPGLRMAGDGIAIAGAVAAQCSGALAALGAAHALGRIDDATLARLSAPHRRELARQQSVRPFLDALYRPPAFITEPADECIVCRCEEVSAATVRQMARLGCQGPNQAKFFSRCGMGPCQGRVCGTVVTQILARCLGKRPDEVGAYRVRPPLKPVPLAAFASLPLS